MACTGMEECGIGLLGLVQLWCAVEEGECFFDVAAGGEHPHLVEKIGGFRG